jgi:hypothetical protein
VNYPVLKDKGFLLPRLTRSRPPRNANSTQRVFHCKRSGRLVAGVSVSTGITCLPHAYESDVEQHEHIGAAALIPSQRGGTSTTMFRTKKLSRKSVTVRFSKASAVLQFLTCFVLGKLLLFRCKNISIVVNFKP